jgi:hypothetical protein
MLFVEVLAFLDEAAERAIGDPERPHLAGLALVLELQRRALHLAVALAQRGGAEALVRFGIGFVADADVAAVEQADDRGDRAFAGQRAFAEVGLNRLADLGERMAEVRATLVLGGFLCFAETEVIAILFPALLVPADRLDMAVGLGAEPRVAVGGGQADRVQPVDLVAVGDAFALGIPIAPAVPHLLAGDAGLGVIGIHDLGGQCGGPLGASDSDYLCKCSGRRIVPERGGLRLVEGARDFTGDMTWPIFPKLAY